MELMKLLEGVKVRKIVGETQKEISGVAYHSQQVGKDYLFAAIRGLEADGHRFINEAIDRGAEAILLEEGAGVSGRTAIFVPNSRQALAKIASTFYGNPTANLYLIGITGTNGKTTTTYLMESILKRAGYKVGVIGTINYRYGQKVVPALNTTPESLDLQRILWEMSREGISHVIMEVSSHGLDLDRVFGCQFNGAIFTNFTSDHLDYHQTLERYFQSKQKLFSESLMKSEKAGRFAVTNADDPKGEEMVKGVALPILRYGLGSSCDFSATELALTFEGISCRIKTPKGKFPLHSKLIGRFNLYNILAAVAAGFGMGLSLEVLKEGVEGVEGVSGRFEKVANQKSIHVIVDYAHTHDALERVLLGLRDTLINTSRNRGRMITVFGCGGDRDRTKRPLMGEVAGRYSDLVVLTSDNPRTEDPLAIIEEVEKGFQFLSLEEWDRNRMEVWRSKKGYLKVPDRREAIRMAIQLAQPEDTVLIAGKGHEDYQIIGKKKFPFDDRVEARKALEEA
ncbi:MAG: UDP-N-acetylmuramoyl-L-alanyl-D-glutamate--2,6-diaminopimelate ligase [Deltaproteobacteria bacterium]|nr:UDP-N-acetylmuramoyl-L-alanyl-D-glutamate--2,6-diaminopimelate ligase [Deltaproteobacteria bacterium]MBM4323834.1 UDP-N-acetylmuramoyl-L-alanyl-D-glutamate--2,6-diaminopimelate ligase [Deltaproteobacteria bacterium]